MDRLIGYLAGQHSRTRELIEGRAVPGTHADRSPIAPIGAGRDAKPPDSYRKPCPGRQPTVDDAIERWAEEQDGDLIGRIGRLGERVLISWALTASAVKARR